MPRIRWALVATLGGLLALPSYAFAAPAPEPNDGIHQAKGPLQANVVYNGTIATRYEDDWFIVYLSGPGTLKVDVTNSSVNCNYGLRARIADADGYELKDEDEIYSGNALSLSQIANAAGTYHVRLSGTGNSNCSGNYSFKATGPLTGGPVPGAAQSTANTGRAPASAIGPLVGGTTYGGRIDSAYEDDWFFFNTNGGGEFDVVVTNTVVNDPYDGGCDMIAQLYSGASDEERVLNDHAYTNTHAHLRYNGAAAARYSLRIATGNCAPDDYQLRVVPAERITDQEPPPPPPKDTDGDGVPDDLDRCPSVAAPNTADGCPPPPDADRDGVPDASDRCPRVAAATPNGCPPPDRDNDGVPDASDRCPGTAAATATGCAATTVSSACATARARRARAKAAFAAAKRAARTARTARARRRWRRIRARRRASYVRAKATARRVCA
jgi:thrombospondin type 3 repeat protein